MISHNSPMLLLAILSIILEEKSSSVFFKLESVLQEQRLRLTECKDSESDSVKLQPQKMKGTEVQNPWRSSVCVCFD